MDNENKVLADRLFISEYELDGKNLIKITQPFCVAYTLDVDDHWRDVAIYEGEVADERRLVARLFTEDEFKTELLEKLWQKYGESMVKLAEDFEKVKKQKK